MESNALALGIFWSPTLQLWVFFGVQRFSFVFYLFTLDDQVFSLPKTITTRIVYKKGLQKKQ
ncbi:MAG: hypothetical protein KAI83_19785 [Thiomargarita sp.]|nr:hypothetical protein [Thiomargarita sp.]